ncbi:unnamed protein product [Gongylonema pulchrum]|uniref:Reverse transcriptase domain-containing protein n=1 Tax=Gongylonema pulchrum TaxID=637853 RepID=A0A183DKV3_9BILA|nr:unnamed protein product [Gongylonema pulchrum]
MCSKTKVQLILKEDVKPVHIHARPVALAIQEQLGAELDRLVASDVITPVDSSDWAAPIMVARKANGKIRLCTDSSTGLNDALKDITYPIPNTEDVMANFSGNTIFSQLDLSDAYLQLRLDESSQKLTTISIHKGLFQ